MAAKTSAKMDVAHIAKLANLPIPKERYAKFEEELAAIMDLVNRLQQVDTKNMTPTSQVTGLENVFREDMIVPSLTQEEALADARRKHNGYFVVDAIFEE